MRKGSLQLSINAIVILVMAIVLLGLGIGFIRGQFDQFENIGQVTEQVQNQILEQLQQSDKKMSIPTRNIELLKKEQQTIGIGVKNTDSEEMRYVMDIKQVQGEEYIQNLLFDTTSKLLDVTDISIEPLKITVGTTPGNVVLKAVIYTWVPGDAGLGPTDAQEYHLASAPPLCSAAVTMTCWDEYASETFFVTVQ